MKVSVIVPVYNEEATIPVLLERIFSLTTKGILYEFVIVDDGSSDKTAKQITAIIHNYKHLPIQFIQHKKNSGKGTAVRSGLTRISGDYVIIQDADLEYDPKYIPILLNHISDSKTKVIYGTRIKRKPNFRQEERNPQFLAHYLGNRFLSFLTSILYGQWLTDMETGYKLFPSDAIKKIQLTARGFDIEPELTIKLIKAGYTITEVAITTSPRGYNDGKKLNTLRDGTKALATLVKYIGYQPLQKSTKGSLQPVKKKKVLVKPEDYDL